jgi:hypothetical protein
MEQRAFILFKINKKSITVSKNFINSLNREIYNKTEIDRWSQIPLIFCRVQMIFHKEEWK